MGLAHSGATLPFGLQWVCCFGDDNDLSQNSNRVHKFKKFEDPRYINLISPAIHSDYQYAGVLQVHLDGYPIFPHILLYRRFELGYASIGMTPFTNDQADLGVTSLTRFSDSFLRISDGFLHVETVKVDFTRRLVLE